MRFFAEFILSAAEGLRMTNRLIRTPLNLLYRVISLPEWPGPAIRRCPWRSRTAVRHGMHPQRVDFIRRQISRAVRAGMGAVAKGTEAILIYLADQPLIEPYEINHLIQAFAEAKRAGKSIVIPFFENQRGNPVILDASYRAMALDIAGDVGCRRIIKRHPEQVFAVQMEADHVIRDIDTPKDFCEIGGICGSTFRIRVKSKCLRSPS